MPIPLNFWWGSVGQKEEKAFPGTALSWCTENWGTKWNAYGLSEQSIFQTDDSLTLTFQTAWGRPIGWLCALFNKHNLSFEYRYMSEGNDVGFIGSFTEDDESFMGSRWEEKQADEETTKHLYALLWGEEP